MKTNTYDMTGSSVSISFVSVVLVFLISGCSALVSTPSPQPTTFYALNAARATAPAQAAARKPAPSAPTLLVSVIKAAAGFDSHRIIYVRQPHKLEYFANSEWIESPSRMLAPLLATALENSGGFRAVVSAPSSASTDLRLDIEILQLQHEFSDSPSRVRLTLRAHLVEEQRRVVIASRDFEFVARSASEDPYGGVLAANEAVQAVLEKLSIYCTEAAANWQAQGRGNDAALRTKTP